MAMKKGQYTLRKTAPRECLSCELEFEPTHHSQRYCSKQCRDDMRREQKVESNKRLGRQCDYSTDWYNNAALEPGGTEYDRWLRRDLLR